MELIPVTDLKQWAYCPRIVYYHRVMPGVGRPTFKMQEGIAAQELIESLEMRRGLKAYGVENYRKVFHRWLSSEALGLNGRLDLILEGEEEVIVVDFKLTSGEPGDNYRMQMAGYALLAEAGFDRPCPKCLLYRIPDGRLFSIPIGEELRARVTDAVRQIWLIALEQVYPAATPIRGRCSECEYANYCADVW
jgi:CRISPR-associated exonuclease Cas4